MEQTYRELNAQLNLYGADGLIQFDKDKEAVRQFFLEHVNPNTVFFHNLKEKLDYLVENGYYEPIEENFEDVKELFKYAYSFKYRFPTFLGAYKFYTSYALKRKDGERYLERYEDRVVMTALYLAQGDLYLARQLIEEIISGRYQPATPTFLNAGKAQRGEMVSCFLLRVEDNMEAIARVVSDSLQLSKRGGGVGILLTNLREEGAPIKNIEGQASGVVPVMKMLEDSFSYANQLGARQGAGAVYLHAHHPDIMKFLDTKRENADEKIRIKTLSTGVVIPDVTFKLAQANKDMYLFSPYDVERVYGKPMSDISVTEHYDDMVDNPEIRKTKINARRFFQTLAELQFESGYPYIMFEDNVNKVNPIDGYINMSNLCVAPETLVLTDKGHKRIDELAGNFVNVWNGTEFSNVEVVKTGEDQKLLQVSLNNGATIDATEYHKWYVVEGYGKEPVVKRTMELEPGDKLIKFDLPVLDNSDKELPYAYTAGMFTADGTYDNNGKPVLRLYGDKHDLLEHLDIRTSSGIPTKEGVINTTLNKDILPKYEVPHEYSTKSKLEWFAGLLDGDGWGNGREGLQIASIHEEFLEEVRLMLQTLGVASRHTKVRDAGMTQFKEDQKYYPTKAIYRLVISGSETQKLIGLGLKTHRIQLETEELQRSATHFVQVVSVEDLGRVDDTYCFTEPKAGIGIFNGVATGQCSEILQVNEPSIYNEDGSYKKIGKDISCNLGSMNIAKVMENPKDISTTVEAAVKALTTVSDQSNLTCSPSVHNGNQKSHAIGLGQMNLHGYLASVGIEYGSEESIEFIHAYMATVTFNAILTSMAIAEETGQVFDGFENSKYATGEYFDKYLTNDYAPKSEKIKKLFKHKFVPSNYEWKMLKEFVMKNGMYHQNLQAIPPTGSISYINNSTASVHPVAAPIEIRKEGKLGRVYYPQPHLTNENFHLYKDAYEIGYEKIIDVYAAFQEHVDQGMSLTLFFKDDATTRDVNRAQIYAWRKGIKSLYYIRIRQMALEGTEIADCVSCQL